MFEKLLQLDSQPSIHPSCQNLLFLEIYPKGLSTRRLSAQLVCFFLKLKEGNSGSSSECIWMGQMSSILFDSYSLIGICLESSSIFRFFFLPLLSLPALQAGLISRISSTSRLQLSMYYFSFYWKEVSFLNIELRILGLILILVTAEAQAQSWYLSLKCSFTVLKKQLKIPSLLMSFNDFLEQQAQKSKQTCRLLTKPQAHSDSGRCMKGLNSFAHILTISMSYLHFDSQNTYSRNSSQYLFSRSFFASAHRNLSTKKVRNTCYFLSLKL